jgi:uncharacterized circularly permuted ATP-grasp superfamily protein/uncharacterized alpha-E superfamily protein
MSIATDTGAPRPGHTGFLDHYEVTGGYDELRDPDGRVRDHWADLASALAALGPRELQHRQREVSRLLRNDGVAYNVHDDRGVTRPTEWSLDPIPLLLGNEEWAAIERGVIQRAELLDLVLADLYGRRDLVRTGLLPMEVVFGHRGFLRQTDQVRQPGPRQLVTYACDLARDGDGRVSVLSDLAQSPSGAGFALENRRVISRVFPGIYRESDVHRLAPFFRTMRAALPSVAPAGARDPRVVVLTPGPLHETYFEHAYLSTELGWSLVQGSDLTVRDGRVWLRSLGGLEPVDVILRRVDGWYCDPLELRPDSQLGVPGLVEAARRGNVSVVNSFGASVVENPGLMPFLPRLAEQLLGRPLELSSATTWWCGDPTARRFVLDHLADLVIRPTARRHGHRAIAGWELTAAEREEQRALIAAQPWAFVAQERVELGAAPCLVDRHVEARPVALRTFAVATDGSYAVMPGGLARVASSTDGRSLSAGRGATSKDAWVLAPEPDRPAVGRSSHGPVAALDPAGVMPSRVAENLFWLGRYAERAEATIRLVRAIIDRRNDFHHGAGPPGVACLDCLLVALTDLTTTFPGFTDKTVRSTRADEELLEVVGDAGRPGSLVQSLRALLVAAQAVRDQLSNDTFLVLADLVSEVATLEATTHLDAHAGLATALARTVRSLLALAGLSHENMVRDPGWRFLDAGRRLERGILLTSLLRSTVVPVRDRATEALVLESVLIASETIITFRRRYRSQPRVTSVLDLLLVSGDNPRSLAFQLGQLTDDVLALPRRRPGHPAEERLVLEAKTTLAVADVLALAEPVDVATGRRIALDELLGSIHTLLLRAATAVDHSHFARLHQARLVVAGQPGALGDTLAGVMP